LTCLGEIGDIGGTGDRGDRGDKGGGAEDTEEGIDVVDGGGENGGCEAGSDCNRRMDLSMGEDGGVAVWRAAT
jgi:hypothetical protein